MWDDLVAWFQSPGGTRVLQTAIIPAVTIVVAALVAAAIARSAVRATIRRAERAEATSVVAGLVAAARLSADTDGDAGARRRAARVRAEADVRARLLPLPGAGLAADWAAARMDALQQLGADGPAAAEIDALRDRLIEWVGKPARARRVFVAPIATPAAARPAIPATAAAEPAAGSVAEVEAPAPTPDPTAEEAAPEVREPDRFARPTSAPGPRRTPPEPAPQPEPAPAAASMEPEPELVGATAAASALADGLPAWQRTRAVERLQQERSRGRAVEVPTVGEEEDAGPLSTAPVTVPRAHRAAEAAAAAEAEEAVRLEAHQQARHARPTDQSGSASSGTPAAAPTPAPAWLDTYDDEAQVTQNLDLKTPPPVAASAVRDRGTSGDDLVPRS